jgi:hypothetical protein
MATIHHCVASSTRGEKGSCRNVFGSLIFPKGRQQSIPEPSGHPVDESFTSLECRNSIETLLSEKRKSLHAGQLPSRSSTDGWPLYEEPAIMVFRVSRLETATKNSIGAVRALRSTGENYQPWRRGRCLYLKIHSRRTYYLILRGNPVLFLSWFDLLKRASKLGREGKWVPYRVHAGFSW